MKHKIFSCRLVFASAIILLCGCNADKKNESSAEADQITFRVKTIPAQEMEFRNKLRIHMNAEPVSHANICAKTPGIIEDFRVVKGREVKDGDILFQTDKFQLETNLDIARQELKVLNSSYQQTLLRVEVAKERLRKAELDYERNVSLYEDNVVSQTLYEEYNLNRVVAEAQLKLANADADHAKIKIEQAENNIKIAERRYNDSIMRAPFDALVVDTYYEAWEYAENAKRVLRLESRTLELTALIPADYYENIHVGETKALITCKNTSYQVMSPVSSKDIYINPVSRTFEIKIRLPEDASVLSGMLCEADIILDQAKGYGLPNAAFLAQADGKYAIYSNSGGTAVKHLVGAGIKDGEWTQIVAPGNDYASLQFVVEGQAFLDDGVKLKTME